MEKQLRYQGEFFSVAGVLWRVEIWQDADTPYPVVGELRFPSDTPLSFEWFETDKLEPVQGSGATLQIVSKVDRQYKDMLKPEVYVWMHTGTMFCIGAERWIQKHTRNLFHMIMNMK